MHTPASAAIQPDIDRVNREFERLFNGGEPAAAARAVYSREARVLPPGAELVQGREAIAAFWAAAAGQMGLLSCRLTTVELQQQGDGAWEIGRATLGLAGGAAAEVKYVVLWTREDGEWKWHVDIWNANA